MTNPLSLSRIRAARALISLGSFVLVSAGHPSRGDDLPTSNVLHQEVGSPYATVVMTQPTGSPTVTFTVTPTDSDQYATEFAGFGIYSFGFNVTGITILSSDIKFVSPTTGSVKQNSLSTPISTPFGTFDWELTCVPPPPPPQPQPLVFTVTHTGLTMANFQKANSNGATFTAQINRFQSISPIVYSHWVSEQNATHLLKGKIEFLWIWVYAIAADVLLAAAIFAVWRARRNRSLTAASPPPAAQGPAATPP